MNGERISRRGFLQKALTGGAAVAALDWTALPQAWGQSGVPERDPEERKIRLLEEGLPSKTALATALHRAAHQLLDDPRIFEDPLALPILGARRESALRADLERHQKRSYQRAFMVLRSRYAEDQLAEAIRRETRQYVILGAGLDTFPYRNPYPGEALRVFEIDHPATQAWKRWRLREAGIDIPDSLTFAPVDFEKQTLADGLARAGFRADQPAFFSWLGVVVYLTEAAVMQTLRFVASLPAGSGIVFDYSLPSAYLKEWQRSSRQARAEGVASIGEPWLTYFDPEFLTGELSRLGFKDLEDFGPKVANERYFQDRADGFCVLGGRLVTARL